MDYEKFGQVLGNTGKTIQSGLNTVSNLYNQYAGMGAGMANAVSQQAQANQFAFNSSEALLQREYNEAMWDKSAEYNSAEAQVNREFQERQADINRQWQERMSNTAYQRAVQDLKKAGLNPVLAAINGGAGVGSGSMASGSQASAGATSGASASGGSYSGQGYNPSESLAVMGVLGSLIGNAFTAMGAFMLDNQQQTEQTVEAFLSGATGKYMSKEAKGTLYGGVANYLTHNRR